MNTVVPYKIDVILNNFTKVKRTNTKNNTLCIEGYFLELYSRVI